MWERSEEHVGTGDEGWSLVRGRRERARECLGAGTQDGRPSDNSASAVFPTATWPFCA